MLKSVLKLREKDWRKFSIASLSRKVSLPVDVEKLVNIPFWDIIPLIFDWLQHNIVKLITETKYCISSCQFCLLHWLFPFKSP